MDPSPLRIAAVADIHVKKGPQGAMESLFTYASDHADILLLCGDLTDYGLPDEARILAKEVTSFLRIPVLAVLGNHDFESGKETELVDILRDSGMIVLDGDSYEIRGVGFAGVKGFGGGFGRRQLGAWGEKIIKDFVHETVNEALKLEAGLNKLRTPHKIGVLHYSPIHATVVGEPEEIVPFLGSSRLEDPLDRYRVTTVFHGHAHRGSLEGKTKGGAKVYNVAMPLLSGSFPDRQPVKIIEISTNIAPVLTAATSP